MRAIILAAGRGRRMGNLTDKNPKCLLKIKEISLLERLINNFSFREIDDLAIVTGYKKEMIRTYTEKTFHNPDWEISNMVSSLLTAEEWLANYPCIVTYSDIFYRKEAIYSLLINNDKLAITYDPNWHRLWKKRFDNPLIDAESFRINDDGFITEIGNRSKDINLIEGQYMGLIKFTPHSWKICKSYISGLSLDERYKWDLTKMINYLIVNKKLKVKGVPYLGEWGEVDSIKDLEIYNI